MTSTDGNINITKSTQCTVQGSKKLFKQVADVNKPTGSKNEHQQNSLWDLVEQDYKVNRITDKDNVT